MTLPKGSSAAIDPVCAFHGKRRSEHACLYCCLCFNPGLTPEECWVDGDGQRWDMCRECGEAEAAAARDGKWNAL